MEKKDNRKIIVVNKEARFRFAISDTMEAGLALTGTEVKSLRAGKAVMNDSHAYVKGNEAWLANLHIAEYSHGNRANHEPLRTRKLLLHKREILQLAASINREGFTIVPLSLYFKSGRVKVELGIAKGKKLHDKRASIKDRDVKREMAKARKRSR